MTDRDVVERVAGLLGTTVHPVAPQRDHHRSTFVARVRGRRAAVWKRAGAFDHLTPTPAAAP